MLPTKFDTLVYWTNAELAELQGCSVGGKLGVMEANKSFADELLPIVVKYPDLFGQHSAAFKGPEAQEELIALAHRMATLIMAYAFDLEGDEQIADEDGFIVDEDDDPPKGMVPLADMLNADGELKNNVSTTISPSLLMISTDWTL